MVVKKRDNLHKISKLKGDKMRFSTSIQININEELNEAEKIYDGYLEKIQEYCENDSLEVKKHLIKFLIKHYEKMIDKICLKRIDNIKKDPFFENAYRILLVNILEDNNVEQFREYTEDSILEHQLFYQINKKDIEASNNLENIYANLLSLYDLILDDLEKYIYSLNKKEELKSIFNSDNYNRNLKVVKGNDSDEQNILLDSIKKELILCQNNELKNEETRKFLLEDLNLNKEKVKEFKKMEEYING